MEEIIKRQSAKAVIQVDNSLLDDISTLIELQETKSLQNIFADLHSADIAEIINHLNIEDGTFAFSLLDNETAGEVVVDIDENLREKIFQNIDTEKITHIVNELNTDDATDILNDLPEQIAEQVLENIDKEDSEEVKELLKYPEDTAGGLMNSELVSVYETATVQDAIEQVRLNSEEIDHIYYIFVLKNDDELVGTVKLKNLLIYPLSTPINTIMDEDLIYVFHYIDQEKVANIMEKYDLVTIPVVNEQKQLLGRITFDDIVHVINEEASEDIQKLAGLSEEEEITDSVFRSSRARIPWLMLGLFGEMISAIVLSSFQSSIERIIIASFFIPVVMAMGGSSGTQAAIVMVRNLSPSDLTFGIGNKKLFKEFGIASLNGIACSAVLLIMTYFFFHTQLYFSLVLSIALLIIMIFATMVGSTVPLVLKRLGIDPAIATGPFVTTMNDIVSLLIYLSLVTTFLLN
ncbi:MAG: magnesium transporter [bacterium]